MKAEEIIREPKQKKLDVRICGIQTANRDLICWACYRLPSTKAGGLPIFRNELTGKEICSICSKNLEDVFILPT